MTTTTISDTRYAVKFVGDPAGDAARSKSLAGLGPLLIAKDHIMARILPDAFDRESYAPDVVIHSTDVACAFFTNAAFATELADSGVHFAVKPGRWAAAFKDVDDNGLDVTPISGEAEDAFPDAAGRISSAFKTLPLAKRIFGMDDVLFDGDPNDAKNSQ